MSKFLKGLKYFFCGRWLPKWVISPYYPAKLINYHGQLIDVSGYFDMVVSGTGLERWGIKDDTRVFVKQLSFEEKNNLEKHPVVMVQSSDAYWFECDKSLKKFCGYIDICPSEKDDVSSEIWEHAQDVSTMMLYPDYNRDIDGYSQYYTLNHPSLAGINRMQFIKLCQDTLSQIIKAQNSKNSTYNYNYHHMSIVCACYNAAYDYKIVPTELIIGKAKYVVCND